MYCNDCFKKGFRCEEPMSTSYPALITIEIDETSKIIKEVLQVRLDDTFEECRKRHKTGNLKNYDYTLKEIISKKNNSN